MDVLRPFLTVHVFGAKQTGKTTVKTQWFDSSQCHALSEVADIHIRLQVCCMMESIYFFGMKFQGGDKLKFVEIHRGIF